MVIIFNNSNLSAVQKHTKPLNQHISKPSEHKRAVFINVRICVCL